MIEQSDICIVSDVNFEKLCFFKGFLVFEIRKNLDLRKILASPKIFLKSRFHCTTFYCQIFEWGCNFMTVKFRLSKKVTRIDTNLPLLFLWPPKKIWILLDIISHSRIRHYFFSYLLTREVDLFDVLVIMAQMWHFIHFLAINQ